MDKVLKAIAAPTRVSILTMLHKNPMTLGEIAICFSDISRPAVSQHIRVLKDAGLLDEKYKGKKRFYTLHPDGFDEVKKFLEAFWELRIVEL